VGILISAVEGAWDVSNEMNELFRDYEFEGIYEFLVRVWGERD